MATRIEIGNWSLVVRRLRNDACHCSFQAKFWPEKGHNKYGKRCDNFHGRIYCCWRSRDSFPVRINILIWYEFVLHEQQRIELNYQKHSEHTVSWRHAQNVNVCVVETILQWKMNDIVLDCCTQDTERYRIEVETKVFRYFHRCGCEARSVHRTDRGVQANVCVYFGEMAQPIASETRSVILCNRQMNGNWHHHQWCSRPRGRRMQPTHTHTHSQQWTTTNSPPSSQCCARSNKVFP